MSNYILNHTFSHEGGYIEVLLSSNHMYITYSHKGSSNELVLEDSFGEQIDTDTLKTWCNLSKDKEEISKDKYSKKIGIESYNRYYENLMTEFPEELCTDCYDD